jgi:hypothetical protein
MAIGDEVGTATIVDTVELTQDIGTSEPVFKRVILQLWSDGRVTWAPREVPQYYNAYSWQDTRYVGDPGPDAPPQA